MSGPLHNSSASVKILVVDDREKARDQLTRWLRRNPDFEVGEAESGDKAIALVQEALGQYDVIVMDQNLGGMTGVDTMRRIKAKYPNVQVLMFTGEDPVAGVDALRQGAYRYLLKPLNPTDLVTSIRDAIKARELEDRTIKTEWFEVLLGGLQELSSLSSSERVTDLQATQQQIAQKVVELVHGLTDDDVALWLPTNTPSQWRIWAHVGLQPGYVDTARLSLEDSVSGVALMEGKYDELFDIFDPDRRPPFKYQQEALIAGWKSVLIVPLRTSTRRVGTLSVYSKVQRRFAQWEKNYLSNLANQAAIAYENVELAEQAKVRQKSLEQLVLSGQITMKEVSAEHDVLDHFVKLACQLTGAPCAAIYPYDPDLGVYYDTERVAVIGLQSEKKKVSHKPRKKGLAAIVHYAGPLVVNDLDAGDVDDLDYSKVLEPTPLNRERLLKIIRQEDFVSREKIKAFIGISLRAAQGTGIKEDQAEVGVLYINFRFPHHFSNAELSLIQLFAQQVAGLIRAARLRTGLQEQVRIRSILAEASNAIAQAVECDDILKTVFQQAFRLTGKTTGSVMTIEADRRLRIVDSLGVPQENLEAFHSRPTYAHEGSFGSVTRTEKVFESRDTAKDLRMGRMLDVGLLIPSQVTNVPLQCEGKVVGILVVDTVASSPQVKDALLALAKVAGIALERANRTRTLSDLNEAGKALTAAPDLPSVMSGVVQSAEAILQADAVVLYLYDRTSDAVVLPPVMKGVRQPEILRWSVFAGDSVSIRIIRSGKSRYAPDSKKDCILSGKPRPVGAPVSFVEREGIVSSAGVLLRVMGEIVGVLFVNYRTQHAFEKAEREKIQLFAGQAAVAVRNALRLEEEHRLLRQADTLREVSRSISAVMELEGAGAIVLEGLKKVIQYDVALIQIVEGNTRSQVATAPADLSPRSDYLLRPLSEDHLISDIVHKKKPRILSDLSDPKLIPPEWEILPETIHIKSWAGVPLVYSDKVIGLLILESEIAGFYKKKTHENLLMAFANQAAISIENARLHGTFKKLASVGQTLTKASTSIDATLETIAREAKQVTGCDMAVVALYDEHSSEYRLEHARIEGAPPGVALKTVKPRPDGVTARVLERGLLVVEDREDEKRYPFIRRVTGSFTQDTGVKSFIGVRLQIGGANTGVLYLNYRQLRRFSERELQAAHMLGYQAAIAIENARLYGQMDQQLRALRRIDEIISAIGLATGDPIPVILEEIAGIFRAQYGSFSTVNRDTRSYTTRAIWNTGQILTGDNIPFERRNISWDCGIVGYVAREGTPYRTGNVVEDPCYDRWYEGVASEMAVPVQSWDGQTIGVLNLESTKRDAFSQADQDLAKELANVAAVALHKDESVKLLQGLHEVAGGQSPQDVMDRVLRGVRSLLGEGTTANIFLYHQETKKWREGDAAGPLQSLMSAKPRESGTGAHVLNTKKPYYVADVTAVPAGCPPVRDDLVAAGTKSFAALPLGWQEGVVGVLYINLPRRVVFTDEIQGVLKFFAGQAAIAIENARLYEELLQRLKELKILLKNNEQIITQSVEDTDRLLNLLYEVACEVMDLSNAQVQFAFYDKNKEEVTFPLAVERDAKYGGEIDRVRMGEREAKYVRVGEGKTVQQLQPRSFKARVGLTEYVVHTQKPALILSDFQRTAEAFIIRDKPLFVVEVFGPEYVGPLDAAQMPEVLREDFTKHGFALGKEALVEVKRESNQWAITDDRRNYFIDRDKQSLKVYSRVKVWPTFGRLDRPTHSWLGVPMVIQGRVIGVISIQSLEQERAFTQAQVSLLTTVANQAAVAIENARLYTASLEQQARIADIENLRVRNQVASDLVHELNNRLGTIPVRVSLIRESLDNRSARDLVVRHLEGIAGDAKRVMSEAKKVQMIPAPEIIDDLCMMLEAILDEAFLDASRPIERTFRCLSKLPAINATRVNLATALRFVVDNALQAMEKTGNNLIIEAAEVQDEQQRREIMIRISNDGPQIPKDVRERLFKSGYTTKEHGSGYGLWRARDLIQDMGGKLVLEEPGLDTSMTTFSFHIPVFSDWAHSDVSED